MSFERRTCPACDAEHKGWAATSVEHKDCYVEWRVDASPEDRAAQDRALLEANPRVTGADLKVVPFVPVAEMNKLMRQHRRAYEDPGEHRVCPRVRERHGGRVDSRGPDDGEEPGRDF